MNRWRPLLLLALMVVACRGASPSAQAVSDRQLGALVDSLVPVVSKATGLAFKSTPKSAIRTREQIHAYLIAKMARELPPAKLEGIAATYRLLGMVPDSIDLRQLFLDLYTEQIAGFYDPDSTTFFAIQGTNPGELRLVLAHELVHALQGQYLALDSILRDSSDADRQSAAQAVLEGQATLVSLVVMAPGMDIVNNDGFWATFRDQLQQQQTGTTVYARAPMVIREDLTFPYVAGADFMRWYDKNHPGAVPFSTAMPQSTEQILHPDRYAAGDRPVPVRFTDDTAGVIFDDTFGEFDIDLLRAVLVGATSPRTDPAIGWGGDRLRIYRSPAGPALVWVTTWDAPRFASQFHDQIAAPLASHNRPGYRIAIDTIPGSSRPTVRVVVAPTGWSRWKSLPQVRIEAPTGQ
jgi:AcrR family transcriptional regulator